MSTTASKRSTQWRSKNGMTVRVAIRSPIGCATTPAAGAFEFAAAVDEHRVHAGCAHEQAIGLADVDRIEVQAAIERGLDAGHAVDQLRA